MKQMWGVSLGSSATTAVVFQMFAGKTGPVYHQRRAGTERSDVAACKKGKEKEI